MSNAGNITSADLANGVIVRKPVSSGKGYWAGAPGVYYEQDERAFYLTYRIRRPRGVAPDRGGEARIARSENGTDFEDIWSATKDAFPTPSIERCALRKGSDGDWRCFVSYVDPADGRWCVAVLKARRPDAFDSSSARRIFSAPELGLEGVKDPWIAEREGTFHMLLSVALRTGGTSDRSHDTMDIYNTGECLSATALASSRDLDEWQWLGVVFQPEDAGWDGYCRRVNSVVFRDGRYVGFYDGSASEKENYEEKTGIAESRDLLIWRSLTPKAPVCTSPNASGSLRYMDAQSVGGRLLLYYEFARADGSHDLRVAQYSLDSVRIAPGETPGSA